MARASGRRLDAIDMLHGPVIVLMVLDPVRHCVGWHAVPPPMYMVLDTAAAAPWNLNMLPNAVTRLVEKADVAPGGTQRPCQTPRNRRKRRHDIRGTSLRAWCGRPT